MGKNAQAEECIKCGELIYYNGNNPCCIDEDSELTEDRNSVEQIITNHFNHLLEQQLSSCAGPKEELLDVAMHDLEFHKTIWECSTEILPGLEVQVVIDGKNNCFVSTGSSGYVDFFEPPVGMSLPIRCWIHTHPFGAAYFSGTDIRTVSIWEVMMETAYVLGGEGHYGFWSQREPQQLEIYVNNVEKEIQTWKKKGDEEE
tara:strand:+ start:274 stop:876 length:603 start_codon:yes stop_codon:yes gene_type:complete